MTRQLIFLELNELNFEYVVAYGAKGELPALTALLRKHPLIETGSETNYDQLEPWIQWVTAHTGLSFEEHGIYRLGDFKRSGVEQIWEYLERRGLSVGAISPMNAIDRCERPAFFMPDPWTSGRVSGSVVLRGLYRAIAQAVNDNAKARLSLGSVLWLLAGWLTYARATNYSKYFRYLCQAKRKPWLKAIFLDLLLADVFQKLVRRYRPNFASLFLNAGAHIQHHYMFNAAVYDGAHRNPDWYAKPSDDPVLDVYRLYDRIVASVAQSFPSARLMLATGLHQKSHAEETFYWRLKDHASFLSRIGAPFVSVEPRMSRDFLIRCADPFQAREATRIISSVTTGSGGNLFEVDNRGNDVFITLIWRSDILDEQMFAVEGIPFDRLRGHVAFVAIKNGEHDGVGYFLDSQMKMTDQLQIPLASIPGRVCAAFDLDWAPFSSRIDDRQPDAAADVLT